MACCIKPIFLQVTEIEEDDGILELTVADDSITDLNLFQIVNLVIDKEIPNTSKCLRLKVTDGDTELAVYRNNQYFRPCELICNSVLTVEFRADPELFVFKHGGRL